MLQDACADIRRLTQQGFPVIDYHTHLKGGLTLEELLEHSRRTGIRYGVAPNCGKGFAITDDAGIHAFLKGMEGKGVLRGMQAEGREWTSMFSAGAVAGFDYVFTDAMTFTDDRGRRTRLWIAEEVDITDAEAFMEMYVRKAVGVLNDEPIDIFVNPTYLPAAIAADYDALWTRPRMEKVIGAAIANDVAIEINSAFGIPSEAFIRLAKAGGARFSLGTNNAGRDLGTLEYSLRMVRLCGLSPADMFTPRPDGKKPVQVKGFIP
jgi:histidinol phosphatase-like PHP family hydrolase